MVATFLFRKSSYSGGQPDSQCVEVADNVCGTVAVRDSKTPRRATVRHSPTAWTDFVAYVRGPSTP